MNDNKIQIIKDDEIDLRTLFQVLWNDRKRIIQITAVVTLMGVLYALLVTPLYKSTISIYPSGGGEISKMAEIKSMANAFGIGSSMTQNSLNIGDILSSRSLQKKLIYYEWNSEDFDVPVNLITYWEIDDTNKFNLSLNPIRWIKSFIKLFAPKSDVKPDLSYKFEMAAIGALLDRIEMETSKTGLHTISVWMEEKDMAADIANITYDFLVEFNLISHINKARMNREFIQGRLDDISANLKAAEEELKIFLEKNRSIIESPQLQLELGRFTRDVELHTQLYITLIEQLELAKIKELDETPTLTILDYAVPALEKDKPRRTSLVIVFTVIGVILGIISVLVGRSQLKTVINY